MNERAEIGVFGGSGFYEFLDNPKEVILDTPYGAPSDTILLGEVEGKKVAFLPRHGKKHQFPPHKIPYRANLWALKQLGVKRIFGPAASGSLQETVKPGDFVICSQFVDRTSGREDTYFTGPQVAHVSSADPYCPQLRELAAILCKELSFPHHAQGTVVVIQGPRFSTRAESKWFKNQGWEAINMTQYPEVILARELEMCYLGIALVTDYDVGIEEIEEPVSAESALQVFQQNNEKVQRLIIKMISRVPESFSCTCHKAMEKARI